ncbi:hypothetical protein B0J11DRAFT_315808 [Dendryphion nanum]|uniref:FAD-binding domain-containing protein n=1 Tax=Dendryphion nanum TaxID=256645 RepID=A0A9P9DMV7_9PLEO|nr:hypothetical protein B0J11DRAFT_315808 [Dendryphion nanum]
MPPLRVLVVGAGIAGPVSLPIVLVFVPLPYSSPLTPTPQFLSHLLRGALPTSTIRILERSSSLRATGHQIDLKATSIPLLKKCGLLDTIKTLCVPETGLEMVDGNGKIVVRFGVNGFDERKKRLALTSEYEVMRGDLVRCFEERSLELESGGEGSASGEGGLEYVYGKSVEGIKDLGEEVEVRFSDGEIGRYDLVVGADGQGSRVRRLAWGDSESEKAWKSTGVQAAYYSIPKREGDDGMSTGYLANRRRMVITRTGYKHHTQVLLFTMAEHEKIDQASKEGVQKQKEVWAELFQDAGWECEKLMEGMQTAEDFYVHEIVQIRMDKLYQGRVVLLGDAGYCPSPFTGMGTTLALVGSYVLAGELVRNGNDIRAALNAYDEKMKEPIKEYQEMPTGGMKVLFPSSQLGVWLLRTAGWAISTFRIDQLASWVGSGDGKGEWKLPEYPELKLKG